VSQHQPENLLDRLIAEAQADDYALAHSKGGRRVGVVGLLALVVVGALLATAFLQSRNTAPLAAQRREGLVTRIEDSTQRVAEAETTATALRTSVSQLQQLATRGLSEDFADQVRELEIAAGFVGLRGPGAVVSLSDGQEPLPKGVTADEARVLDVDMQMAVNGLWQAGAQAIAINGIRLTSMTAIRTAGEAILVDFRPLVPPYSIVAIGPQDLARRFSRTPADDELRQLRKDYGIESSVEPDTDLEVPASTANLPNKAVVMKGGAQ
jgi:uncharacterized protein YlxW (UPF0749 family)